MREQELSLSHLCNIRKTTNNKTAQKKHILRGHSGEIMPMKVTKTVFLC